MSPWARLAVIWVVLIAFVLMPFVLFEEQFTQIGVRLVRGDLNGPAAALAIGALLAFDVFLPVPSSIVSAGAGAILGFWSASAVIWIGMTAGCVVAYVLGGWWAGAARRFAGDSNLDRAGALWRRHGLWALAVCRPIPVLAEATVVFAGLVRTPMPSVLAVTALANAGIAMTYAAAGAYAIQFNWFALVFDGAIWLPAVVLVVTDGVMRRKK